LKVDDNNDSQEVKVASWDDI